MLAESKGELEALVDLAHTSKRGAAAMPGCAH